MEGITLQRGPFGDGEVIAGVDIVGDAPRLAVQSAARQVEGQGAGNRIGYQFHVGGNGGLIGLLDGVKDIALRGLHLGLHAAVLRSDNCHAPPYRKTLATIDGDGALCAAGNDLGDTVTDLDGLEGVDARTAVITAGCIHRATVDDDAVPLQAVLVLGGGRHRAAVDDELLGIDALGVPAACRQRPAVDGQKVGFDTVTRSSGRHVPTVDGNRLRPETTAIIVGYGRHRPALDGDGIGTYRIVLIADQVHVAGDSHRALDIDCLVLVTLDAHGPTGQGDIAFVTLDTTLGALGGQRAIHGDVLGSAYGGFGGEGQVAAIGPRSGDGRHVTIDGQAATVDIDGAVPRRLGSKRA